MLSSSMPEQCRVESRSNKDGAPRLIDETERLKGVLRILGNTVVSLGDQQENLIGRLHKTDAEVAKKVESTNI